MSAPQESEDFIDQIQAELESRGWKAVSGEGWRWVNHTFRNDEAQLRVRYLPKVAVIRFDFESDDHMANLLISFRDSPGEVLKVITGMQSDVSESTWELFITDLIRVSPKIVSVSGEDYSDEEIITSPAQGASALHEIDWE